MHGIVIYISYNDYAQSEDGFYSRNILLIIIYR